MKERAGRSAVPPVVSLALVSCVSLHRIVSLAGSTLSFESLYCLFSSVRTTGESRTTGSNREGMQVKVIRGIP